MIRRDREISFLAHRYLRSSRWLRGGAAHLFFDTVKAYYMELAEHILQDLSSVEMDGIDSLFCGLVYRYWEIFPTFSTYATSESFDMRRIGEVILRFICPSVWTIICCQLKHDLQELCPLLTISGHSSPT